MQYSVNEVEGLLVKAARGAGTPAGQASAFGKAGALHLARGGDVAQVDAALAAAPKGAILENPAQLQTVLGAGGGLLETGKGDLMESYALALPYTTREVAQGIEIDMQQFDKTTLPARITLAPQALAPWHKLAANTYVPETEASRLGGAGAGLTDND